MQSKTEVHTKSGPACFNLATEVHLSLLLFLQRGPPRFNWALIESKSPLPLQPLELIPPLSALSAHLKLHEEHSFAGKWSWNLPARDREGAGRHLLSMDNGNGNGPPGRNSHLALLSSLWEKPLRATGYLSTQPVSLGLLFPVGHICILTGKYSRF